MWRGGCIIRSAFLGKIKEAFDDNRDITNLLLDPFFKEKVEIAQKGWRNVVSAAVTNAFLFLQFPRLLDILTVTGAKSCLPIFYRPRGIISEHIPMNELINREVNSFIPTGQAGEEQPLHQPTMYNSVTT